MKRKASRPMPYERPTKLSKESTECTIKTAFDLTRNDTLMKPVMEPLRLGSFRQRKAPSWLSSYVTTSLAKDSTNLPATKDVSDGSKVKKNKTNQIKEVNKREIKQLLKKSSTIEIVDNDSTKSKVLSKPALLSKQSTEIMPDKTKSTQSSTNKKSFTSLKAADKLAIFSPSLNEKEKMTESDSLTNNHDKFQNAELLKSREELNQIQEKIDNHWETTKELGKPTMLEVVFCISTSGAMRDYLSVLQDKTRDMVWRLQSLIPNMRIGVFAHTQGGIHDDKFAGCGSAIDHNYIRVGGHSGTKWLDLGATYAQICAFVGSLEPEATVYPDYVQENLEMALWKLQRCMSWSDCSYRAVIMLGRGRPNRTSFYLQREHWRGWIRSALQISKKMDIPVIDWELEAKLLAQMGIHVFTVQALPSSVREEDEDEGSAFYKRVAELTSGLHVRLNEASKLIDILLGICCACYGPDLLQEHRSAVRDENDGVLPDQLKNIFISLQLHSKARSLTTMPAVIGDLSIVRRQLDPVSPEDEESEEEDKPDDSGSLSAQVPDSMDPMTTAESSKPSKAKTNLKIDKKVTPAKTRKQGSKKLLDKKKKLAVQKTITKKNKSLITKPSKQANRKLSSLSKISPKSANNKQIVDGKKKSSPKQLTAKGNKTPVKKAVKSKAKSLTKKTSEAKVTSKSNPSIKTLKKAATKDDAANKKLKNVTKKNGVLANTKAVLKKAGKIKPKN